MIKNFILDISNSDFLKDYKKRGDSAFIEPDNFNTIGHFAEHCRQDPNGITTVSFSSGGYVPLNLGDEVLINNIYYKVISKSFDQLKDKLIYHLIYN